MFGLQDNTESNSLKNQTKKRSPQNYWLGLTIGNSRLHWGLFQDRELIKFGEDRHLSSKSDRDSLLQQILDFAALENLDIYLASVVPQQTKFWLDCPQITPITLQDVPLGNLYPTLGIDRALAVCGAGSRYGYPCLVIDGGTALTFTGVDSQRQLVGGAIIPGMRSQLIALKQQTAALPKINLPEKLPKRWSLNTPEAIASGVTYTAIATIVSFINDWCSQFPQSAIILTGGDASLLSRYLHQNEQLLTSKITVDPHLILWGIRTAISAG